MSSKRVAGFLAGLAGAAVMVAAAGSGLLAQKVTAADSAAKFSGTWKLNRALSPGLAPATARPGPAGAGGAAPTGGTRPLPPFALAVVPTPTVKPLQKGGGGGAGPTVSDADRAAQKAMRDLQGAPDIIKITATADSVTFLDSRGERTYAVTDKNVKMDVGSGAIITQKSKWDKNTLNQNFSYGEDSLTATWEVNAAGNQMNFHIKIQNLGSATSHFTEVKAVYDKQ